METVSQDKVLETLESERSLYFRFPGNFCVIWKPTFEQYMCCAAGPLSRWCQGYTPIVVGERRVKPGKRFSEEEVRFLAQKAHTIKVRPHEIDIWGLGRG